MPITLQMDLQMLEVELQSAFNYIAVIKYYSSLFWRIMCGSSKQMYCIFPKNCIYNDAHEILSFFLTWINSKGVKSNFI